MPRSPSDLMHGTLDVLVLRTLSWQPMHGYAIMHWIEQRTSGVLGFEDAALYKALHRLERAGAIESEWGISENNRRVRFYTLTREGGKQLAVETEGWLEYVRAVQRVMQLSPA